MARTATPRPPTRHSPARSATWANPELTGETRASLQNFANTCMPPTNNGYQQNAYRAMRQNALLQLIATSPDLQTS